MHSATKRSVVRPAVRRAGLVGLSVVAVLVVLVTVVHQAGDQLRPAVAAAPDTHSAPALAGLDESGQLLPRTAYPVPSKAVFLSPSGDDSARGTSAAPVASLARAVALVPSGGTVVVRGGVLRDGNVDTSKPFTLQAYPGEQPWFDGTDVVPDWAPDGAGHWWVPWSTPDFCRDDLSSRGGYDRQVWPWQGEPGPGGPCVHPDMVRDPANPAAADPQMVFVDGAALRQETELRAVTSDSFWYDTRQRRLYSGVDPVGHLVEVARRASALVMRAGPGTVRGIGFRRYATNEKHEASVTHGALTVASAPEVTIENSVFTRNAAAGVNLVGAPHHLVVDHSVFSYNGFNGIDGNGNEHDDDFVLESSILSHNNTELFGLGCSVSCSAAGSKVAHMDGVTIRNNLFEHELGAASGFWCDLHCSNAVIVGNVFSGNGGVGLFYEVSDRAVIASNLVYGNGYYRGSRRPSGTDDDISDRGSGIRVSAAHAAIYNNTLVNNVADLVVYDDERTPGGDCRGCDPRSVGPDTHDVQVVNNLLSGVSPVTSGSWLMASLRRSDPSVPGNDPDSFYTALDHNSYYRPAGEPRTLQVWGEASGVAAGRPARAVYASLDELRAAKKVEEHGQDVTVGRDPFFRDAARGDYCVRAAGDVQPGGAVPPDVAAALGLEPGPVPRGAVGWLGSTCRPTAPWASPVSLPPPPAHVFSIPPADEYGAPSRR